MSAMAYFLDVLLDIVLDGGEYLGLRHVYEVVHIDAAVIRVFQDVIRSGDEFPLDTFLLQYLDV